MSTPNTPVQPRHIKAGDSPMRRFSAFEQYEADRAASLLVSFCQERGHGWQPVALREFRALWRRKFGGEPVFGRLIIDRYVRIEGEQIILTVRFVAACYGGSPAT